MDSHAQELYSAYSDDNPHGHFHKVIALQCNKKLDWSAASDLAPELPKGWYELSRLTLKDRIDFTREFWLSKLPYHRDLNRFLENFFQSLDDIAIFLTQANIDEPFRAQCVYSLRDNGGFFRGDPPATENQILNLRKDFPNIAFPADYLAFLSVHNGFAKLTDTGITQSGRMKTSYEEFNKEQEKRGPAITCAGTPVNPASLIPFYKSFNMPFYQCFWSDWYPENEPGNVYYSGATNSISDCTKADLHVETMAFETFTDWLIFYLEKID